MKKVMFIFGTRPEAIKMCPVIKKFQQKNRYIIKICTTGQHKEMLDIILEDFGLTVDYNLQVMTKNQTLTDITVKILTKMQEVLDIEKPDLVLVHGDTTTAYATALSCFYNKVKVAHVEAGLRTYDLNQPYPEEFNRESIDKISELLFAPTENAAENIRRENHQFSKVFVTGNTVIDALQYTVKDNFKHQELEWGGSKLILMTMHRRENWGKPMEAVFSAILRIVQEYNDVKVIYPVHKNPIVRRCAEKIFAGSEKIHLIEPLDVIEFHNFLKNSYLVVTDSGGIQEEAPSFQVPVLIARNKTERPEGIEAGVAKLIGTDYQKVYENVKILLTNQETYKKMVVNCNPYGDGKSSDRIEKIVNEFFEEMGNGE